MNVLTGVPPITIKTQNLFHLHELKQGNRPIIYKGTSIKDLMLRDASYNFPDYYKITNLQTIDNLTDSTLEAYNLKLYTDGSVMEGGSASAFTVTLNESFIHDHAVRLHYSNSIYQAELFAILEAVKWFTSTYKSSHLNGQPFLA